MEEDGRGGVEEDGMGGVVVGEGTGRVGAGGASWISWLHFSHTQTSDASLPPLQQDFVRYGRMCYMMFLYAGSRSRVCLFIFYLFLFFLFRLTLSETDLL